MAFTVDQNVEVKLVTPQMENDNLYFITDGIIKEVGEDTCEVLIDSNAKVVFNDNPDMSMAAEMEPVTLTVKHEYITTK